MARLRGALDRSLSSEAIESLIMVSIHKGFQSRKFIVACAHRSAPSTILCSGHTST